MFYRKLRLFLCASTIFFSCLSFEVQASELDSVDSWNRSAWDDAWRSFGLIFEGFYKQFQVKNNLYYLPPAIGATWYAFENDKNNSERAQRMKLRGHVDFVGEMGVPLNFPIISLGAYAWAAHTNDNHLAQFAMEYFATLYLTLGESALISFIDIHERPVADENLNFWETTFRGDSSFPSGHVMPYTTLFFKTLQFYGPAWSIIPFGLTVMASQQRVRDGKHYLSDVVGAFFLTAFASEGVRYANNYSGNHPFYQRVFERNIHVGLTSYNGTLGPMVSWDF